jgi:CubicO group peptidase (beta-lactamase class C family)
MYKYFKYLFIISASSFFLGCTKTNSEKMLNFSQKRQNELNNFIDTIYHTFPLPGLAVAVIKGDSVYYKAMGYGDLQKGTPFTDSTLFFTGNLSELMTATAVVKLAESGKIDLDDPVVKYLPYFKLGGHTYQTITIKHLLTQTGGVPNHGAVWDLPYNGPDALENTTKSIALQPGAFSPGSKIMRSQYNYDILADLVSKVTGMPFEQYVEENVFQPMSMKASTYNKPKIPEQQLAKPHHIEDWLTYKMMPEKLYPYNREYLGSIGYHTSVADISKWMFMLLHEGSVNGDRFLYPSSHTALMDPQFKTGDSTMVGMGWEIFKKDSKLIYKKNHQLGGFSADLTLIPEDKIGVIIISNIAGDFNPTVLTNEIIGWLKGKSKLGSLKKPVAVTLGQKYAATKSLDSVINTYTYLRKNHAEQFSLTVEDLSQFGVNMLYRANKKEEAINFFKFCIQQYPESPVAQLNLAEAYLINNQKERAIVALANLKKIKNADLKKVQARLSIIENALKK